jgi:CheY-like chemotaxis protein
MNRTQEIASRAPKVLIVDDDPTVAKFLDDRCAAIGLNVQVASNGLEALVKIRRDPPDVLIADVRMPELDGLSLSWTLLEPGRRPIDVIVVSGYLDDETIERCESFGALYAHKGPELWHTIRGAITSMFPHMSVEVDGPVLSRLRVS